jgi:hypothetical protein
VSAVFCLAPVHADGVDLSALEYAQIISRKRIPAAARVEPKCVSLVLTPAPPRSKRDQKEEILMRYKLVISALTVAAWFGTTAISSAQVQPAPGASSERNAASDATKSNKQPGMTTGSVTKAHTNKGVAPNPAVQSPNDAGTSRGK